MPEDELDFEWNEKYGELVECEFVALDSTTPLFAGIVVKNEREYLAIQKAHIDKNRINTGKGVWIRLDGGVAEELIAVAEQLVLRATIIE